MADRHPGQKRYPLEMKERAVRMVLEAIEENNGDRFGVIPRIAHQLGVGVESLRGWVNQLQVDRGQRGGTTTEDKARIARLERENRELRRANEILKSAAVFFGAELDRRQTR
jgi:transposase